MRGFNMVDALVLAGVAAVALSVAVATFARRELSS